MAATPFEGVPNELLLAVASFVESLRDLNALCQVKRRFHAILEPMVYDRAVKEDPNRDIPNRESDGRLLRWAAIHNQPGCAQKSLDAGFNDKEELDIAIELAAARGNDDMIRFLAQPGRAYIDIYQAGTRNPDAGSRDVDGEDAHHPATPLIRAAENGHLSTVLLLLKLGADPNTPHVDNAWTALCYAIKKGHHAIVRALVERGAHPEGSPHAAQRPIFLAVQAGDEPTAQFLLASGARAAGGDSMGRSPLSYASQCGHEDCVRCLLDNGAAPEINMVDVFHKTPLTYAIDKAKSVPVVRLLLRAGASPQPAPGELHGCRGIVSSLHLAACLKDATILKELIHAGAHPNEPNVDGNTPLYLAAMLGLESNLRALLQLGADPNISSDSPLAAAAAANESYIPCMELLLEAGSHLQQPVSCSGMSLLSEAILGPHFHEAAIQLLLSRGARIEDTGTDELTALEVAAGRSSNETFTILLSLWMSDSETSRRPASTTSRILASCLLQAAIYGKCDAIDQLVEVGVDVNHPAESNGCTALFYAAETGSVDAINTLVRHGADPNARNYLGEAPIFWSARKGKFAGAKQLCRLGADRTARDNRGRSVWETIERRAGSLVSRILITPVAV